MGAVDRPRTELNHAGGQLGVAEFAFDHRYDQRCAATAIRVSMLAAGVTWKAVQLKNQAMAAGTTDAPR